MVGIRNEVKTAHDNISMLNVQIEAVQADINNFHMKNLKNIKVQGEFTVKQIAAIMLSIDITTQKRRRRLN